MRVRHVLKDDRVSAGADRDCDKAGDHHVRETRPPIDGHLPEGIVGHLQHDGSSAAGRDVAGEVPVLGFDEGIVAGTGSGCGRRADRQRRRGCPTTVVGDGGQFTVLECD